jgi:glycosyltransferase involved in cell wall biosynthesis
MKILQVVQKPQRRGPEILAQQLNQRFRQQGHTVGTIYLYPYNGDKPLSLANGDVTLEGQETHFFEKLPGFHPTLLRQFVDQIRQFQPEIIQVNGARTIKYGAFAKLFSPSSPGWVLIYRNIDNPHYWIRDPWRRLFYRWFVVPQMDGVIGVSEQILGNLKAMYSLKVPSVYIPYVADPTRLEPILSQEMARQQLKIAREVVVILFIGNLSEQKRPDRFVRVIHQVYQKFPNLEAWLLGDGPWRECTEKQVQALGLTHLMRFWGYQTQIGPHIAAADLLLVTSDSDGIPTVVQEAGFLGKPTVATQVGGMSECIVDGQTGILVDPQNEGGMAQAVLKLIQHPEQRVTMGEQARQWVQEHFTIDKVVDKHVDFYRQVLRHNQRNEI